MITMAALILYAWHYIQDWIFQRASTAYGKTDNWRLRGMHCLWYTLGMSVVFILIWHFILCSPVLSTLYIVILWSYIFGTHFLIDTPGFKKWICRNVRKEEEAPLWYYLKLDEILHCVSLVPLVFLFYLGTSVPWA